MEFSPFQEAVYAKFKELTAEGVVVLRTDAPVADIFDVYLDAWPEEHNQIFREKREHDCNCCKQFIRAVGNLVAYVDGELVSVWDIESGNPVFAQVASTLSAWVKRFPATTPFYYWERRVGTKSNVDTHDLSITWNHFYADIPSHLRKREDSIASLVGKERNNYNVLKRSIIEITPEAVSTVLELIDANSLYRGAEHKKTVQMLERYQANYQLSASKDEFLWKSSRAAGTASGIRNTVIGSLLVDLSEGEELETAVKKFEAKVAPANYKRTSALITQAMINRAQNKVIELGYQDSIQRRHATIDDLTINNVLFADRSTEITGGIFGNLTATAPVTSKGKEQEISIEDFMSDVLPTTSSLELLLENSHESKLVTLVSPVNGDAASMLAWDNNFSWTYNGDVTDAIQENVKAAGGNVDGVLRFSIQWNTDNRPHMSDLDAHCVGPRGEHIYFSNMHGNSNSGVLDVDIMVPRGVAVENIVYTDASQMPDGDYKFLVHNYSKRSGRGFSAQIAFGGNLFDFDYDKVCNGYTDVATVSKKGHTFSIKESLPHSESVKQIWSLDTKQFHKVKLAMLSPNHWDDNAKGNKHYFFMLDKCANPNSVRGFYNEFLDPALRDHRKVFEHLGSQMKAPFVEDQLSGVGFSSTIPAEFTVRADGRTYKVTV